MSRIKQDLSLLSLNQLCTLTGMTSRTLKKRLAGIDPNEDEVGTLLYVPSDVLPVIYGALDEGEEPQGDPKTDPWKAKARLDTLRGDKLELELAQARGQLLPVAQVEATWIQMLSACRAKLLSLPSKLAPQLVAITDPRKIERAIKDECYQALEELAGYGIAESGSGSAGQKDHADPEAPTEPESQ